MKNLGKAVGILILADCVERFMHADVRAWGAPSECHDVVSRGAARRRRQARRHAEAIAQAPLRVIEREVKRRTGVTFHAMSPRCQSWYGRVYEQQGWPF